MEIVSRFLDASRVQQEALRGADMEVEIDAQLPKLEKQGKWRALRSMSKLGHISYKPLAAFIGDNTVKNEVIARYMTADDGEHGSSSTAITPANYKFQYKASISENGHKVHVFQLKAKKSVVGLFNGELWLDEATGMPLKSAGQWVKVPSKVFLKKIQFTHVNVLRDGIAFPKHVEWKAETRFFGRAELSIEFVSFTRQESDDVAGAGGH